MSCTRKKGIALSSLQLSGSSVPTIQSLIGMLNGGTDMSLTQSVALELIEVKDGQESMVRVEIPRRHRIRWSRGRLEVRRGDGGIFFALSIHPGWNEGRRELCEVSSSLRRLTRNEGAPWRARKRGTAQALA